MNNSETILRKDYEAFSEFALATTTIQEEIKHVEELLKRYGWEITATQFLEDCDLISNYHLKMVREIALLLQIQQEEIKRTLLTHKQQVLTKITEFQR